MSQINPIKNNETTGDTKTTSTPVSNQPIDVLCMACADANCSFKPITLQRRPLGEFDVQIEMKYSGVCHSDLHIAAGHIGIMGKVEYPCVPGHELAGVAVAVGSKVTKIKIGDHCGVGCMVDSCLSCKNCLAGEEQKCSKQVSTYQGKDNGSGRGASYPPGSKSLGGYTNIHVCHEHFVIKIPKSFPLEYAGPVMCAGVTMYDPLRRQKAKEKKSRVGIVGLGGLGVMGAKLALALGCECTVISRTASKKDIALKTIGATRFILSTDKEQMKQAKGSLDLILNTIPVGHPFHVYGSLLAKKGKQVILGLHPGLAGAMIVNSITCGASKHISSGIGGIQCTQEVIDLCAEHDIKPEIEMKKMSDINEIYKILDSNNDGAIRYVLDISTFKDAEEECKDLQPPAIKESTSKLTLGSAIGACCALLCCCRWC